MFTRRNPRRRAIIVGTTLMAFSISAGCSGYVPRETRPEKPIPVYRVGDVVQAGEWRLRVHRLTDPLAPSDRHRVPAAGQRWIRLDVELTNLAAETRAVAAVLQFEIQDDKHRAYEVTVTGEHGPDLDGYAPPGGSRRGVVDFEVGHDSAGLRLNFGETSFDRGRAVIDLG